MPNKFFILEERNSGKREPNIVQVFALQVDEHEFENRRDNDDHT